MNYHAPTKQFTITASDIERCAYLLRYAIRKIRRSHDLDPRGYSPSVDACDAEYAESAILDAAQAVGIDLGAARPGVLDVSRDE